MNLSNQYWRGAFVGFCVAVNPLIYLFYIEEENRSNTYIDTADRIFFFSLAIQSIFYLVLMKIYLEDAASGTQDGFVWTIIACLFIVLYL